MKSDQQHHLFPPAKRAPFQRHSESSRQAAEAQSPEKLSQREATLLSIIRAAGKQGLTDQEGQTITGISGDSYRPTRVSLNRAGLIGDSGRKRQTRSGRYAVVWVVK